MYWAFLFLFNAFSAFAVLIKVMVLNGDMGTALMAISAICGWLTAFIVILWRNREEELNVIGGQ